MPTRLTRSLRSVTVCAPAVTGTDRLPGGASARNSRRRTSAECIAPLFTKTAVCGVDVPIFTAAESPAGEFAQPEADRNTNRSVPQDGSELCAITCPPDWELHCLLLKSGPKVVHGPIVPSAASSEIGCALAAIAAWSVRSGERRVHQLGAGACKLAAATGNARSDDCDRCLLFRRRLLR